MQFRNFFGLVCIWSVFATTARTQTVVALPCEIAYIGTDSNLAQKRLDTTADLLFTYTEENLRPFFKNREYMSGKAYLSYVKGGYYILHLHFFVASLDAPLEYQQLPSSGILNIQFMNDEILSLRNAITSTGQYDAQAQAFVYKGQYPLSGAAVRRLQQQDIDKIQVYWSQDFEWYEIYDLDFFKTKIDCIKSYILNNNF